MVLAAMMETPMPSDAMDDLTGDIPTLEDFQHWTLTIGRAQQLLMEFAVAPENREHMAALWAQWSQPDAWASMMSPSTAAFPLTPEATLNAVGGFWEESLKFWQQFAATPLGTPAFSTEPEQDRRFTAPEWQTHPLFAFIRQSYAAISERMLAASDAVDGIDPQAKAQLRFATQSFLDAMSPSNFALTNPLVLKRTAETRGANLVKGLEHMLSDLKRGQLTHVDRSKFAVGRISRPPPARSSTKPRSIS
jgi:polyhydroxyalkanoate synthase subunit PhaC